MPDYMRVGAISRFGYAALYCFPKENFSPPQQRRGKINTKLSLIAPKERLAKSYNYSLCIVKPLHGKNQIIKLSNESNKLFYDFCHVRQTSNEFDSALTYRKN
jgi:hypothetical protein